MKINHSACACAVLHALSLGALLSSSVTSAMSNLLMGRPLEDFLSDLVYFGDMTKSQKRDILAMADDPDSANRLDYFATDASKDVLRAYLYAEVSEGRMEVEATEQIASTLSLGAMYPSASGAAAAESLLLNGPVQAVYNTATEGNMVRLGTSRTLVSSTTSSNHHNGIWGYATGQREYALQCHGKGLAIVDVTVPVNSFRVQLIPMDGGGVWRDVATHYDASMDKTFAYVGAQERNGDGLYPDLYVIDLSYLSGDLNNPNSANSDPIPSDGGYVNLGMTQPGLGHTINVARGLLFLNTAYNTYGCMVYDLTVDPWNPAFLFNTAGSGQACHDSFVRENIDGKDVLFVSDGGGMRERIYDITDVDSSWPTDTTPPLLGSTTEIPGIYAHECWLSEDNRYLFEFDESNDQDIIVWDVSNLAIPEQITIFQYSEHGSQNGERPHNGMVRGNYLYAAYYSAGLRVFDISNPRLPVEVGKVETHRDPDGDGNYENGLSSGTTYGAWNLYPYLPSGNILVNDKWEGLFIVGANAPYNPPAAPVVSVQRDASNNVMLSWSPVANARGYSVERSLDGTNYEVVAEHLVTETYLDDVELVRSQDSHYIVKAVNGEGVGTSTVVASVLGTSSPSTSPTSSPTSEPTGPVPTQSPTVQPTKNPTKAPTIAPTGSPVLPGICSDDLNRSCSTTAQCACGSGSSQGGSASSNSLFGRKLLTDPCNGKKNKDCSDTCTWNSGLCVSTGPITSSPTDGPTISPTSSPSKSPTSQPTKNPTQCTCYLTAFPTMSPTTKPSQFPTSSPTPPGTCLSRGSTCPADRSDCCSGACVTRGQNLKCS